MKFRAYSRHFFTYFLVSLSILGLFAYIRSRYIDIDQVSHSVISRIQDYGFTRFGVYMVGFLSFFTAFFHSFIDMFVLTPVLGRQSFGIRILGSSLLQLLAISVTLYFALHQAAWLLSLPDLYVRISREMDILIILQLVITLVSRFLIEIDRKLGPGNLKRMLLGQFYSPREKDRIFMFIDLKSSTSIAEKLGHLKFSALIQQCFQDLAVVGRYRAEVYQYVGDEAVICWPVRRGLKNNQVLHAFFAFQKAIQARNDYYMRTFGLVPEFKAGVHLGTVTVTEVGELKREICYHGDILNTASRIQGLCNDFQAHLLISEDTYQKLERKDEFTVENVGYIQLKGKQQEIGVYKIGEKFLFGE